MARTQEQIEQSLDTNIQDVFDNPSTSNYAEWKLWKKIFAAAIYGFEMILDAFRFEVESIVSTVHYGNKEWYEQEFLKFQGETLPDGSFQGDTLILKNGVPTYEVVDVSRRIIEKVNLTATGGQLSFKVAKKLDETHYQKLTDSEKIALDIYAENIKYPGSKIYIISQDADKIKYDLTIYYDPIYSPTALQTSVIAILESYRTSFIFDDKVFKDDFNTLLKEIQGVKSVKINSLQAWKVSTGVYEAIDEAYALESGYFNFDSDNCTLTFINYKDLFV